MTPAPSTRILFLSFKNQIFIGFVIPVPLSVLGILIRKDPKLFAKFGSVPVPVTRGFGSGSGSGSETGCVSSNKTFKKGVITLGYRYRNVLNLSTGTYSLKSVF
jgi:hypothetical protein